MASKIGWAVATVTIVILSVAVAAYYFGIINPPSPVTGQLKTPTDQADLNWAGYTAVYSLSDPKPLVTGVSGSWVVPQVQISQNDTYSAVWVGIGGFFGHSLIQTGTEQDSVGGTVQYFAWYELLPSDEVVIASMAVSSGDEITASISLENSVLNIWSIRISDLTTGQSFIQDVYYNSSRLSAEWVVERHDVNNPISELANFGNITMQNCNVTVNNEIGAFGYFPSVRLFMYDMNGTRLSDVSYYTNNGSSFTVRFLASR